MYAVELSPLPDYRTAVNRLAAIAMLLTLSPLAFAASVNPKRLAVVESGAVYRLAEPWSYREQAATFTLKPGDYVLRYEDAKAAYLLGEGACVDMHVVPPKQPEMANTQAFPCGIYLPKDAKANASFFFIRGQAPHYREMGPVVNAIIKAGEGSFDFPTSRRGDAHLRGQLVASPPMP